MPVAYPELHGRTFDVVVIGGGINGSSAAQQLAAAGYECLLVEKEDFGSGASGRSARMLHPGLRFFEAPNPVRHFGLNPGRFLDALKGARQAMLGVSEHLRDGGDRIRAYRMCFPVRDDAEFKAWHLRAGLSLLQLLGDGGFGFDKEIVTRDFPDKLPFFNDLQDPHRIKAVAVYNEFKFEWPERFCADMALDAERNGATLQTYCTARLGSRDEDGTWTVQLIASNKPDLEPAEVRTSLVLNMAGTWIDGLLPASRPLIEATKGTHLIVEMPDAYEGFGIAGLNSLGQPHYVLPHHKNLFSIGVTETPFEGDATDVAATDEEIDFLIQETNRLLPGRRLSRADVMWTWAGVRPLTHSGGQTKIGRAPRTLHDLENRGLPGVLALTGGPIMTHRSAGRDVLAAVRSKLQPSRPKRRVNTSAFAFSSGGNSPPLLADEPDVRIADLELSVTREHARTLTDVLLRRTGLGWRRKLTSPEVERSARIVAPLLQWSTEEEAAQVGHYLTFQDRVFRRPRPQADDTP
ncbi:MAG: FAD-dependent oxidoreductase [Pseudomonadota bacterium]